MKPIGDQIRSGRASDRPFLEEMLVEAACWRPNAARPPRAEILERSDLVNLLARWGERAGDTAVVAESHDGSRIGAAWFRFWSVDEHSHGFVAPDVPELAIAVRARARGRGFGGRLLRALLVEAVRQGIARVSLSVEFDNPALRLYRRVGFLPIARNGGAWTMLVDLAAPPGSG